MKYSLGFRASVVRKTQDGSGRTINQVARETGISVATVSNWLEQFKNGTLSLDGCEVAQGLSACYLPVDWHYPEDNPELAKARKQGSSQGQRSACTAPLLVG